ncbi:periplasmic binding protein/LacI transcriptional regulator [Spirochaeta thermophila DSM 6578]|uniref:Periplasmic binding protein/LacI transcriptional regulator n=1 Tax=Winmispira thermophila (strain ATCC 700085 / DSM 6578 / Z-1203) TaxID=869211 RepID=G0GEM1_WINT7|nr:ABC transporter substrate-binding protein [Spirochaeta thermophila]AEJ60709.1 periplasmic binding protein/LacI transcriptional regulator [Spirochaeta thermophila DSM 6578]
MKLKRWVLGFLAVVLVALPVFAGGEGEEQAVAEKKYVYAVISKGFMHEFWLTVKKGCDTAAKELGVFATFEGPATEAEVAAQIAMVENAITRRVDGILLAALDKKALVPVMEKAKAAGIPIVMFDSGADAEYLTLVATDNRAAAARAADYLAELIGGEGKVGVIVHDATSQTGIDRRDGFLDRIKEKYPKIQVVNVVYGGGDHAKSQDLIMDMVRSNPDLKGIFAANEGSAVGAALALEALGAAGRIKLVGYDTSEKELEFLKKGVIQGMMAQNPFNMGYLGLKILHEYVISGKKPESTFIDTGATLITAENLETPEVQRLLYPFKE